MSELSARDRRQRRMLIGLALIFFAPLGLAFYLYYGHGTWHPGGRVNAGELVRPVRPLPPQALTLLSSDNNAVARTDPSFLKGKWTFLYVGSGACAQACRERLYDTRQVRLALDRDMNRVQRVFIAQAGCCDADLLRQHPDLIAIRADSDAAALLAVLPERNDGAPPVYLIDPLGNLMMSYPAATKSKGMLEDMKRLLRLSSIG